MKYKENKKQKFLKHKEKEYTVQELIKELNLESQVDILVREDSWFNLTMEELDNQEKKQ